MENLSHQIKQRVVPKLALTRAEAAEALGITPVTVDRLAKRGLLRPSRATRRPLYSIEEIERFLRDTSKSIVLAGGVL
jgi:predicted site-specific integrase-resolvase